MTKKRRRRLPAALIAPVLGVCSCNGVGEADPWTGACPDDSSGAITYAVVVSLSDSERTSELFERRLDLLKSAAREAADCETEFFAALIDDRHVVEMGRTEFDSVLGTESARDLEIPRLADPVVAEIEAELTARLEQDPPTVSDPGLVYQYLADLSDRLEDDGRLKVFVLSDGVTVTPTLSLNRPLEAEEVDDLAHKVAPMVDLGEHAVAIDWHGLGATSDPHGAPAEWVETLKEVWLEACVLRSVDSCVITTTI